MQTTTLVTHEEYFELLTKSDFKLEYNAGEIVLMKGFDPAHNLVTINVIGSLGYCLKDTELIMLGSQQLIRIEEVNKYTFPDLVITGLNPKFKKSSDGPDALLNPEIVIEVLSESTEKYDRLEKFDCYKTIPSFREYVLVSSKMKKVEVIKKLSEAEWLSHTYNEKDEFVLIGECSILMADIYNKVDLL